MFHPDGRNRPGVFRRLICESDVASDALQTDDNISTRFQSVVYFQSVPEYVSFLSIQRSQFSCLIRLLRKPQSNSLIRSFHDTAQRGHSVSRVAPGYSDNECAHSAHGFRVSSRFIEFTHGTRLYKREFISTGLDPAGSGIKAR